MPWVCLILVLCGITARAAEAPEAMQHARKSYELTQRGDLDGATEEIRAAIQVAPENALYVSALGGIAKRQGNLDEATECFERAVNLDPSNPVLRSHLEAVSLDLGAELAQQQRFKAGLMLAQDTARRFPESARAQQMLGLFATRNQQNLAAVTAYQRALALSPDSSDISVGLGIAQTMAGQLADAVGTFEAGIKKWPADAAQYQAYGVLLLRQAEAGAGSEEQGIRMLSKALELDSSLAEAHYQLGNVAIARGHYNQALEHLLAALHGEGQSGKVHFALSRAYRAAGKAQDAEQHAKLFREQQADSRQ